MHIEGRYPSRSNAKLDAKNILAGVVGLEEGGVKIRIDDADNPDMWLVIWLSKEEVLGLLKLSEGDGVGIIPDDGTPVRLFTDETEI
jgi:hypothetical protein